MSNLLLVCSNSLVMRLSGACVTAGPSLVGFLPFFAVDILFVPFFLVDDFLLVAFFAVVVDDDFLLLVATLLDFSLPLATDGNDSVA